jgi:hypothetical protein
MTTTRSLISTNHFPESMSRLGLMHLLSMEYMFWFLPTEQTSTLRVFVVTGSESRTQPQLPSNVRWTFEIVLFAKVAMPRICTSSRLPTSSGWQSHRPLFSPVYIFSSN